jgi:type IV pilus modification protein PilV
MNMKINRKISQFTLHHSRGMSILDVLLGMVIFVVGMLALASLQGNLTRSTSDANARTVGTNIAEELIERLRTIEDLEATAACPTDLDGIAAENVYQCIVSGTATVPRNNMNYTVAATVQDWYFMPDRVTLTENAGDLPSGVDTTISDFKYLELQVSWVANDFLINDGTDEDAPVGRLGSGTFTVSSIIPSIAQLGAAKVASDDDGEKGAPPIVYTPGLRPNIVAIKVDEATFKESTTPVPDVIRADELVETWFDVTTYNTISIDSSVYLRREEFLVVSCECTLEGSGSGFLPTIWNGESYTTGNNDEMVPKTYGSSASNQQSQYCDTCCRDHHDVAGGAEHETYDPSREWSDDGSGGDHEHYTRARKGGLEPVNTNGTYVEACRMVRKDGYMRVAQDFRMEGLYAFPAGYLDTLDGVEEYSDYVTAAVTDFYENNPDVLAVPGDFSIDFPADRTIPGAEPPELALTDTTLLPLLGLDSQQLRSRGIYLDRLGPEAQDIVECLEGTGPEGCYKPEGVNNVMQVLPFYDIQTTWLAWWVSDPAGIPVSVTSEEVKDNNIHSRGLAVLEDLNHPHGETVDIYSRIKRGNTGITVTDPITPGEEATTAGGVNAEHTLFLDVNGGHDGEDPPAAGYTWSGMFVSGVNKVDTSSATVTPGGSTFCSRSGTSMSCVTTIGEPGSMTVTGYSKKQGQNYVPLYVCVTGVGLSINLETRETGGINNLTTISWPPNTVTTDVVISIENSDCGT